MSPNKNEPDQGQNPDTAPSDNTINPLPGEAGIPNIAAPRRMSTSKKGLLAIALAIGTLAAFSAMSLQRWVGSATKADDADSKLMRDKPTAAMSEPRRLDMPAATAANTNAPTTPRIPALVPTAEELAEPIGVRRTGAGAPASSGAKVAAPEDAPVLLVSAFPGALASASAAPPSNMDAMRASAGPGASQVQLDPNDPIAATTRNLQTYQRQLQGLIDNLSKSAALATGQASGAGASPMPTGLLLGGPPLVGTPNGVAAPSGVSPIGGSHTGGGLFGGQLQASATPRVSAALPTNRSLTLSKGTAFTCALKTKVISATSGLVGCQVQRHVFSDDGRVLLIERGSHLDGEYRITSVRPGMVRIPILWTRIRTPLGVTVDIESPGTGPLGESGIDGHVDSRWVERIGAAMLLSLIDDSVKLVIQNQSHDTNAGTVVLPSTTANTSKLAEKVLDSTINIPPLIYQNQGGIVGIYVARDVDFSSVYELQPVAR